MRRRARANTHITCSQHQTPFAFTLRIGALAVTGSIPDKLDLISSLLRRGREALAPRSLTAAAAATPAASPA